MCEAVNKLYVQSELVYKFPEWNLVNRRLIVIVLYTFFCLGVFLSHWTQMMIIICHIIFMYLVES